MWPDMHEPREKRRKVTIACATEDCNGVITHTSWLGDHSPRVDNQCSNCGRYLCVKLARIEEQRIIQYEIVD